MMAMMIDSETFRKAFENATLEEIIKERDELIREIRRYEKGKNSEEDYCVDPSPEVVYMMNNEYLAQLCYLIVEKKKVNEES